MKFPIVLRKNGATVKIYCSKQGSPVSGSQYYTICWKGARGRERNTRSSLPKAQDRAYEILNDLCAGRADRIKTSAETLSYWRSCAEKLGAVPLMTAVDFYLSRHKPLPDVPLLRVVYDFEKVKETQGASERHLGTLRHHLSAFQMAHLDLMVAQIDTPLVERYLSALTNYRTRRNHRITLVTFGRWAVDAGYLTESPFEKTTNPIVPPTDPGILTPTELRAVLKEADECTKKFIVLGAFAGLRASEILRVRWCDVDWSNYLIVLGRQITKTKRRRTVHIQPNLRAWILAWYPGTVAWTKPIVDCLNPHLGLRAAAKAAGVVWKHNALRHSSISYMMALTRNAASTAESHGNSEAQVQENYKANVTEADAKDWYSIFP